ncbi:hypothetical protein HJG54_19660 [Leptolyngbya sp. NK1-12]|uniref:Uncharacterized protein n=1 Tax=Leptolyngbya sp. NK1-12 TaxID=2547451 RepID=A0AA96WHQ0_9CYAN|nr:hypothetical protein [Leptolyngbya sp. NK1-12]WNZ24845.1 hypothetical protein HJG54_19660 [Leptolyngbya sp. NK1-12]
MPDLTFNNVAAKLPANSLTASGGDILISVKAVMGEANVSLSDQKLGEFIAKFLEACSKAQTDHNAINNPKFRSYNPPAAGAPFYDTDTGSYHSTFTYTVSVDIPLDQNVVRAVESTTAGF